MNIKNELIKVCIFMLLGAYLCTVFIKKDVKQPEITQKQEQKQDCKVIVKKITKPDGSVDEITEFLASSEQKQEQKVEPKKVNKYFVGLSREYNFKNQKEGYELHLGRKITDNLGVFFSYNSEQTAGLGVRLDF